ncbi:MAG: hypothetical protein M1840_007973 [Geoglossum simile]|nr:MAG: hypothetical protein M1840_007973 [Geoglossum simile]
MLRDVKLPFFPRIQDCMVWSADGDIAIAAGDTVQIVSPRPIHKTLSAEVVNRIAQVDRTDQWDLSCFRANDFYDGALGSGHAGFDIFSIGEEQSTAFVSCIGWSPPGIARYRRCVLAVLSTTHVLSLFEPPSSGPSSGGWRRVLVVNTAVRARFESLQKECESENSRLHRLRGRIRAFSWSYESRFERKDDNSNGATNEFFLALANEYNEIVFARIYFDGCTPARPSRGWGAQVTGHIRVHPEDAVGMRFESSLPNRLDRFVNKLSWSPWYETEGGRNESFVAYSTRGELRIMKVSVTTTECQSGGSADPCDSGFQISDLNVTVASAFSKRYHFTSVVWYEKVWNGRLILAFAAPGSIQVVSVLLRSGPHSIGELLEEAITVKEYPNKYWDSVTGMVLRADPKDSKILTLHVVTQLSHTFVLKYSFPEANLYSAKTGALPVEDESWTQAISFHLASFDSQHNLGGQALAKTWGLARSPVGGFVAACITLHPKGMIEYVTHNNESCRVVFGMEQELLGYFAQPGEDRPELGILDLSIEAFVQDAIHLEAPPESEIVRNIQRPMLKPLEQLWKRLYRALRTGDGDEKMDTENSLAIEYAISRDIIHNPTLTASRYQRVIGMIHLYQGIISLSTPSNSPAFPQGGVLYDDIPVEILFRLITSILSIPRKWARGSRLSKRILYAAACVGALGLHEVKRILELSEQTFRWLADTEDVDLGLELEHCKTRAEATATGPLLVGDMRVISFPPCRRDRLRAPGAQALFELCEVCEEPIGWQDVKFARCSNNHVFVRCALTFLAIQRPGISKYCGVCGKEYLSEGATQLERVITPDEGGASAPAETPNTKGLAQVLLEVAMGDETEDRALNTAEGEKPPTMETRPSLASLLFAACDVCVYCGGKFRTDGTA